MWGACENETGAMDGPVRQSQSQPHNDPTSPGGPVTSGRRRWKPRPCAPALASALARAWASLSRCCCSCACSSARASLRISRASCRAMTRRTRARRSAHRRRFRGPSPTHKSMAARAASRAATEGSMPQASACHPANTSRSPSCSGWFWVSWVRG
jgi:hypothetical protein